MPHMDGIEATHIIREELKLNIPIIAISSISDLPTIRTVEGCGVNLFLQKPLKTSNVLSAISEVFLYSL